MHTYVYAGMHAWVYEQSCVCACKRVCTFLQYPSTSIELASLALRPPPPPLNIENLPTHMGQAAILWTPFETQNYFTFIP